MVSRRRVERLRYERSFFGTHTFYLDLADLVAERV